MPRISALFNSPGCLLTRHVKSILEFASHFHKTRNFIAIFLSGLRITYCTFVVYSLSEFIVLCCRIAKLSKECKELEIDFIRICFKPGKRLGTPLSWTNLKKFLYLWFPFIVPFSYQMAVWLTFTLLNPESYGDVGIPFLVIYK